MGTTWHKKHISTKWGIVVLGFMLMAVVLTISILGNSQDVRSRAATKLGGKFIAYFDPKVVRMNMKKSNKATLDIKFARTNGVDFSVSRIELLVLFPISGEIDYLSFDENKEYFTKTVARSSPAYLAISLVSKKPDKIFPGLTPITLGKLNVKAMKTTDFYEKNLLTIDGSKSFADVKFINGENNPNPNRSPIAELPKVGSLTSKSYRDAVDFFSASFYISDGKVILKNKGSNTDSKLKRLDL